MILSDYTNNIKSFKLTLNSKECAKFRDSPAIVSLVSSCHRAIVPSWVEFFFRGYFVGKSLIIK